MIPLACTLEPLAGPDFTAPRLARHPTVPRPSPLLPPLTRDAKRVLWTAALMFLVCVALRLNGSSIGCLRESHWNDLVVKDSPSGLLLSSPKMIRSDEWLVWTPAILSQAQQSPAFPSSNPSLGAAHTPLLMSIPARDYTMFLRPQLWGYFLLPVEFGFAWNWDGKIFGLFAAMFYFFWQVTGGKFGPALFGAIFVLFSPLVQWWLSSPSMLPEMLTYWALGVSSALRIFAGSATRAGAVPAQVRFWAQWPSVLVLAVSMANLILCCYPPFAIVLVYLGLFVLAGYVWQHQLLTGRGLLLGATALGLAALLILPWFLECYPTLQVVAQTVYPGHRQCFGGSMKAVHLFSGFLSLALTESNAPAAMSNVCEASSFYPLWLLPLGLGFCAFLAVLLRTPAAIWAWLSARGLQVMLAAYLLIFCLFALLHFSRWLCHVTLLTRTVEVRGLLGLGLAGTLLLVLHFASPKPPQASWKTALPAWLVWSAGVLAFLLWQQPTLLGPPAQAAFITPARLWELEGLAAGLGLVYLCAPRRWAMLAVAAPFVLKTALINPVCVGLPQLLDSPALNQVRALVQAEPKAQWVFYHGLTGPEILKSTGAQMVNGVKVIPDPALIHILDPQARNTAAYDRYAHLIFELDRPTPEVSVRLLQSVFCDIEISVPQVRALFPGVRMIAASKASPELEGTGFHLWHSWPEDSLWIYRLTQPPRPSSL